MGANASAMHDEPNGPMRPKLEDIPESCMALILSYLDPPEIAKMARINRSFRAAASADFIWIPKLPSNYPFILSELPDQDVITMGKKDIYARLCSRTSFDGRTKESWIDKTTGGTYLSISSKAMTITGIDDRRYWSHIQTDESRFQTVAYLQQIWWLEVGGDLEFQFPAGTYSLFFRLRLGRVGKKLGRRVCNADNVHGWDIKPAQFQLSTGDGQQAISRYMLDNFGNWVHYHVGDFAVEDPNALTKLRYSLTQIDCTHTKGGLCVDSVLICPKSFGKELVSVNEPCKK